MNKDSIQINESMVRGFDKETNGYVDIINTITKATIGIIDSHAIKYDKESVSNRINTLKVVQRDGQAHEYISKENSLYLSRINQEERQFSNEEMVIFTTHELWHMIVAPEGNNDFGKNQIAFDEFFTDYMTLWVASKIGGIALESYYRHNVQGYFGNNIDHNFIHQLQKKYGLRRLLECYVHQDEGKLIDLVGAEFLDAMNKYFVYFDQLSERLNIPLKTLNQMLAENQLPEEKAIINLLKMNVENCFSQEQS